MPFYPPSLNILTPNPISTFPCFTLCPRRLTARDLTPILSCHVDSNWIWPVVYMSRSEKRMRETLGYIFLTLNLIWLYFWQWLPSLLDYHTCCVVPFHGFSTHWVPIILFLLPNLFLLKVAVAFFSWFLSTTNSLSIPLVLSMPL